MKIYVVIQDPDYYQHYDSVHPTLDEAKNYVVESERVARVERSPYDYDTEMFTNGSWKTSVGEVHNGMLAWGYPGSGHTHGIITEEVRSEDGTD